MKTFIPRLDILPEWQRRLYSDLGWARLQGYVLYGGTAAALYLGHRESKDFDFFSDQPLDKAKITKSIEAVGWGIEIIQNEQNAFSFLTTQGNVKLSFFGTIQFGRVDEPQITHDKVLAVASPLDLMGTKLKVLFDRIEAKDYVDIAQLAKSGVSLAKGLSAGKALFPREFSESECLRALTYFVGGDLDTLDSDTRMYLREIVKKVDSVPDLKIVSMHLSSDREEGFR